MLLTLIIWQSYIAAGMCYTLWIADYVHKEYGITLEQHVLEAVDKFDEDFVRLVQSRPQWIWKLTVSTVTVLCWPLAMINQLHKLEDDSK
jgi:hypothetical protein